MERFLPIRLLAAAAGFALLVPAGGARAAADTEKILKQLGFPADTIAQVKAGQMVKIDLESSNERELGVGLAFLVKETPQELRKDFQGGLLMSVDADVEAHGTISGAGSLDQFAGVKLSGLEDKYRNAKAGDLNLSSAEIEAFQATKGKPASAVEEELRKALLARYQAYHSKGLDGIAPYDRGGKQRSGAADLRSATEAASAVKQPAPSYYDTLLNYPKRPASGFEELYNWQRYEAHGEPVYILTHAFFVEDGDAISAVQRQFYVSGSYNVEQAMAGFLPVSEGTLVIYLNRTSTDQVAGFGGGTKRSVGKKLMATQLEELYTKLQKAAVK